VTHFLYVVRHGQADPHDGPLSPAGQQQARLTGQRLRDVPFSGVYHGPLPRAAQTASLIAASLPGVPVSASDLAGDYLPSVPDPDGLPPTSRTSWPVSRPPSARPDPSWPPPPSGDSPGRETDPATPTSSS
jgi:broad specificity phosphatase PhoE